MAKQIIIDYDEYLELIKSTENKGKIDSLKKSVKVETSMNMIHGQSMYFIIPESKILDLLGVNDYDDGMYKTVKVIYGQ